MLGELLRLNCLVIENEFERYVFAESEGEHSQRTVICRRWRKNCRALYSVCLAMWRAERAPD
jgi:hypothetical protein